MFPSFFLVTDMSSQLSRLDLSLESLHDAEVELFNVVLAFESQDDAPASCLPRRDTNERELCQSALDCIASAADSADVADRCPNRSLSVLAECIAHSVTTRAVIERLVIAHRTIAEWRIKLIRSCRNI
jgi:hypothetical protein